MSVIVATLPGVRRAKGAHEREGRNQQISQLFNYHQMPKNAFFIHDELRMVSCEKFVKDYRASLACRPLSQNAGTGHS